MLDQVNSSDGTPIAFYRRGSGPPLVVVPGSGAANPIAWTDVIPTLEKHFTVYAMDRRGHGESGDGPSYSLAREFEDIAAIVDSIGTPAHLLGHSFGALCALEAALLTPNIHKLILYEPAIPLPDAPIYPEGLIDRLQALLDAGEEEEVVTTLYREVAMLSPDEIRQLKAAAAWPSRLATAHTLPREAWAEESYRFDPLRFSDLATPVLLLLGGNSPESYKKVTHLLAKAVPISHVAVIPGQQHIAMYTAPDLFLQEVLTFLEER